MGPLQKTTLAADRLRHEGALAARQRRSPSACPYRDRAKAFWLDGYIAEIEASGHRGTVSPHIAAAVLFIVGQPRVDAGSQP